MIGEPIYIAQTHETEHTETNEVRTLWCKQRLSEARERGALFFRATVSEKNDALLFEGWAEKFVDEQGDPRWQLVVVQGGNDE